MGPSVTSQTPLVPFFISAPWPLPGMSLPLRRTRSEEHTSELQSQSNLVCRLLLEKKKTHRVDGRPVAPLSDVREADPNRLPRQAPVGPPRRPHVTMPAPHWSLSSSVRTTV